MAAEKNIKKEKKRAGPISEIGRIVKYLCITAVIITWIVFRKPEQKIYLSGFDYEFIRATKQESTGTTGDCEEQQHIFGKEVAETENR